VALIDASNYVNFRTNLVHMVAIFEMAYGMPWKSRRRSWIKNAEEVELYLSKTSEMIYMP